MAFRTSFLLCIIMVTRIMVDISSAGEFDDPCPTFNVVPWENFTRDPSSLNDKAGRPLGYYQIVLPYLSTNPNARNPCVTLNLVDSAKQTVQIMATGVTGDPNICEKSNRAGAQKNCDTRLTSCPQNAIGGSNQIKYVFSCLGCESDVSVWIRLGVSPLITDGLEFENWCNNVNTQYPNDLIKLPYFPTKAKTTMGSASFIVPGATLLVLLTVFTYSLI